MFLFILISAKHLRHSEKKTSHRLEEKKFADGYKNDQMQKKCFSRQSRRHC